jgi:hypothetical protein
VQWHSVNGRDCSLNSRGGDMNGSMRPKLTKCVLRIRARRPIR